MPWITSPHLSINPYSLCISFLPCVNHSIRGTTVLACMHKAGLEYACSHTCNNSYFLAIILIQPVSYYSCDFFFCDSLMNYLDQVGIELYFFERSLKEHFASPSTCILQTFHTCTSLSISSITILTLTCE